MARREYTAGRATTLAGAFNIGATTFTIADDGSATTWPTSTTYDFFVTIDAGTAQEERVLCSERSGRVITVATSGRGKDSTGEKNHASGATVWPSWSATDADEANAHINSTGYDSESQSVHGLGSGDGVVVGTNKSQTLTAKTLTSPTISSPTITGTITGAVVTSANIVDGTITGTDIASGTITSTNILDGTITGTDIASGTITSTNILDGTITSSDIADGTIVNADINASAAIAQSKIANLTTDLSGKQATITGAATTITGDNLTASRVLVSDASGKVAASSSITTGELALLNGLDDTGWDIDPGTAGGSWNGTGYYARAKKFLGIVTIHLYAVRDGSTVTNSGVEGNITDALIYTLDSAFYPTYGMIVNFDIDGRSGGSAIINADGTIYLRSMYDEDSSILNGDSIRLGATYIV